MRRLMLLVGAVAVVVVSAVLVVGASAAREDGMFVFQRVRWATRPSNYSTIYVANADGTGVRRVTSPSAWSEGAVWSPDGSRIAYAVSGAHPRLIVMNADGSGKRQLRTDDLRVGSIGSPAWSPDGRRIAFIWSGRRVGIVNADGTDFRFAPVPLYVTGLDWSPDGKRLAFGTSYPTTTGPYGLSARIWVVNLDGSGLKLLARNASEHPRWSPDGKTVLFTRDDGMGIYVVHATGGTPRLIHKTPRNERVWSGATWLSDGAEIAFFQNYQLHVLRLQDKHDRVVTLRPPVCGGDYPCFSVDWETSAARQS